LYHQLAEGNLIYDRKLKAYFPSDTLTPSCVGLELLRPRQRKLDFQVLRLVHEAIREKWQLKVVYQSMNRESRTLTLEPHTLLIKKGEAQCGLRVEYLFWLVFIVAKENQTLAQLENIDSAESNGTALMVKLITRLVMLIQM
jgi:hypothetical protein